MKPDFVPSPAQLAVLELDADARAAALEAWRTDGYFWLAPQSDSEAQVFLGAALVVPYLDAPGDLAVVYRACASPETAAEDPGMAGLYFTVRAGGVIDVIDGNVEWNPPTLDGACEDLIEVGRGLGHFEHDTPAGIGV